MSIETVRDLVARLTISANALVALGMALDERASGAPLDPSVKVEVDNVLAALGATDALTGLTTTDLRPVLAAIRTNLLQASKVLSNPTKKSGWTYTEAEILQSIGELSAGVPRLLKQAIVPELDGLGQRLGSSDAAFLDVGVGVGALSIAMARLWPSLRVVGIDPWPPALALARENVKRAELETRIALREQTVQALADEELFDLAWVPGFFIHDSVIEVALARLHRALRHGGWIVFGVQHPGVDPLTASLARLRTVLWGGTPRTSGHAEHLLIRAGFVGVRTLPGAAVGIEAIVGQR